MTRINTNVPAIRAINRLAVNQKELSLRLERLATGLRINAARDDPAGLIISELLRSDIRTIQQAIDNSTRANSVIATAEGAMNEMSAQLLELQGLIVESSNKAGLTQGELEANQLAVDSILDSIDRIASTTAFAGKKLLDGGENIEIVDGTSGQPTLISSSDQSAAALGVAGLDASDPSTHQPHYGPYGCLGRRVRRGRRGERLAPQ